MFYIPCKNQLYKISFTNLILRAKSSFLFYKDWKLRGPSFWKYLSNIRIYESDPPTCGQAGVEGHTEVWRIYRDTPEHRRPDDISSARSGRTVTDSSCSALELHRWNEPERWTRVWRRQCSPFAGNVPKNEDGLTSIIILFNLGLLPFLLICRGSNLNLIWIQ